MLEHLHLVMVPSVMNHTIVRNYLIISVLVSNPHRSGCIINMTLEEFQKGGTRIVDDYNDILVYQHKTKAKFGPGKV